VPVVNSLPGTKTLNKQKAIETFKKIFFAFKAKERRQD
jgi:hypothetical protein